MKPLSELKTGDKIITSRGDVYVVEKLSQLSPAFQLACDRHFGSETRRFWSQDIWYVHHLKSIGARILDNELAP